MKVEAGREKNVLLALDIEPTAVIGNTAGVSIPTIVEVELISPDVVDLINFITSGDSIISDNLWESCGIHDYINSKYADYSAFNLFYPETGTLYGRINNSVFLNQDIQIQ